MEIRHIYRYFLLFVWLYQLPPSTYHPPPSFHTHTHLHNICRLVNIAMWWRSKRSVRKWVRTRGTTTTTTTVQCQKQSHPMHTNKSYCMQPIYRICHSGTSVSIRNMTLRIYACTISPHNNKKEKRHICASFLITKSTALMAFCVFLFFSSLLFFSFIHYLKCDWKQSLSGIKHKSWMISSKWHNCNGKCARNVSLIAIDTTNLSNKQTNRKWKKNKNKSNESGRIYVRAAHVSPIPYSSQFYAQTFPFVASRPWHGSRTHSQCTICKHTHTHTH